MYLNELTKTKITFAPGQDTNNKVELSPLWSVLKIASEKNFQNIKLCGDSKLSIDWEKGQLQINAPHLQHLLSVIRSQMENFESISFQQVYIELNGEADKLSKEAIILPPGLMVIKDYENNILVNQYVRL